MVLSPLQSAKGCWVSVIPHHSSTKHLKILTRVSSDVPPQKHWFDSPGIFDTGNTDTGCRYCELKKNFNVRVYLDQIILAKTLWVKLPKAHLTSQSG